MVPYEGFLKKGYLVSQQVLQFFHMKGYTGFLRKRFGFYRDKTDVFEKGHQFSM